MRRTRPERTGEGSMCGTIGDVGCFSFFSNKNLPVGEGGMVVTDDDALAERARLLRSHGMTTLTWDRHRGHASNYDVVMRGFNYRLDELRATIALVQLGRLERQNAERARIVDLYRAALDGRNGLTMPFESRTDVIPVAPPGGAGAARGLRTGAVPRLARGAPDPDERPLPADSPLPRLSDVRVTTRRCREQKPSPNGS